MKFVAALIATASAASFPSFDSLHAHCGMTTVFNADCDTVYNTLSTELKNFKDPSNGVYNLKQQGNGQVWATRVTLNGKYTDDVEFTVATTGSNGTCAVQSKSRSQSLSYYDYDVNYCNQYNVIRSCGLSFSAPTTSECKWVPKPEDLTTTCDRY